MVELRGEGGGDEGVQRDVFALGEFAGLSGEQAEVQGGCGFFIRSVERGDFGGEFRVNLLAVVVVVAENRDVRMQGRDRFADGLLD